MYRAWTACMMYGAMPNVLSLLLLVRLCCHRTADSPMYERLIYVIGWLPSWHLVQWRYIANLSSTATVLWGPSYTYWLWPWCDLSKSVRLRWIAEISRRVLLIIKWIPVRHWSSALIVRIEFLSIEPNQQAFWLSRSSQIGPWNGPDVLERTQSWCKRACSCWISLGPANVLL